MNVTEALNKVIKIEDKSIAVKKRIVDTVGEGAKLLSALNQVSTLGPREKAVIERLTLIAQKALALLT